MTEIFTKTFTYCELLITKKNTIMKQKKGLFAAIALLLFVVCTSSWISPKHTSAPTPVTITAVYDFRTFPAVVVGTFTTTGLNGLSGSSTMLIHSNSNGIRAHCDVVLYPNPAGSGAILIDQECEFAGAYPWRGQWQIVGGTSPYANLKGNGSLTMPSPAPGVAEEAMTGVIY